MADIARDSTHWYDRNGNPVYTVAGANGQPVTPDIRHARKLGLLPGVTGVLKVQAAPALIEWMRKQAFLAALTLPRIEGESVDDFMARADTDSKAGAVKARDDGQELHTALERAVKGESFDQRWRKHVEAVDTSLQLTGVDFLRGDAEHSFAHPLGFGGKNDWHSKTQNVLLDYKSKPKIEGGKRLAYDEHIQQLTACAEGFRMERPRLLSVFVGVQDAKVIVHEWDDPLDCSRGWQMFQAALTLWQLKNRYNSAFSRISEAA